MRTCLPFKSHGIALGGGGGKLRWLNGQIFYYLRKSSIFNSSIFCLGGWLQWGASVVGSSDGWQQLMGPVGGSGWCLGEKNQIFICFK